MKSLDITTVDCKPKPRKHLTAHVSTLEDGSTSVLCLAKDTSNPGQCSITGNICSFVRGDIDKLLGDLSMPGKSLADIIDSTEKRVIKDALARNEGDREKTANELELSPTTLWRKMMRHEIK